MSSFASQPSLDRRIKVALYALVLLSVAASTYSREVAPLLIAMLVSAVAWLLTEVPQNGWYPPKMLINISLLGAALNLFLEVRSNLGNESVIVSLGHFIVAILLCKLFERKGRRDLLQILVLSLLIVISGAMFSSSSVVYALLLAAYLVVLLYAIVLLNFGHEAAQAANVPELPAVHPNGAEIKPLWRDLRRVAFRCFTGLVPVALIVFCATPRTRTASLASSWGPGTYQTGFSEVVQFRDYGQLAESEAVVMQVAFSRVGSGPPENLGSEFREPYYRGQTLDAYSPEHHRWYHWFPMRDQRLPRGVRVFINRWYPWFPVRDRQDDPESDLQPMTSLGIDLRAQTGGESQPYSEEQTYTMMITPGRSLFFSGEPAWIGSEQISNVGFNRYDMTLRYTGGRGSRLVYAIRTIDAQLAPEFPTTPAPIGELGPAADAGRARRAPPGAAMVPEAITQLALQILPEELRPAPGQRVAPDKIRAAMAEFEGYLKSNYPYSLTFSQVDPKLDPTADFLLNRKSTGGHCEYFASAMVMLCRSVGINARMVTGYHGGEYNSIGMYYIVRQKDAHAWAEAYVPDSGWVLSDPSPMRGNFEMSTMTLRRWARELGQLIQNAWLSTVVSFDNDSREAAFGWIDATLSRVWHFFTDYTAALFSSLSRQSSLDAGMRLSALGPAAGLLVLGVWMLRRWRRDRQIVRESGSAGGRRGGRLASDVAFLDELLRMLGRLAPRSADLTPREFIDQLALGSATEDAYWLIDTAYAMRFGSLSSTVDLRGRIASSLRRVRECLRAQPNPAS